ncbi:hypothetical protein [Paenibacillus phytorum]|nr:hypothetical protein [Paenibacillus phytorum]
MGRRVVILFVLSPSLDHRHIVFNGYVNGARRVFLADLIGLL